MARNRELQRALRSLQQQGVAVKKTKKNHICVITPKGPVYCASTPSDHRAVKNALAMLRRKGIKFNAK